MEKFKKDLEEFVANIKRKTIKSNEVIVGMMDSRVVEFLSLRNILLESNEIVLSVNRYNHALRDFKKKIGKAIPNTVMEEIYRSINNPKSVGSRLVQRLFSKDF